MRIIIKMISLNKINKKVKKIIPIVNKTLMIYHFIRISCKKLLS